MLHGLVLRDVLIRHSMGGRRQGGLVSHETSGGERDYIEVGRNRVRTETTAAGIRSARSAGASPAARSECEKCKWVHISEARDPFPRGGISNRYDYRMT
jgi:hypothetical protein